MPPIRVARAVLLPLVLAACAPQREAERSADAQRTPVLALQPDAPLAAPPTTVPAAPSALQRALGDATGPVTLRLAPGHYVLLPEEYTDPTCGNCADPDTPVPATLGARVTGRGVEIVGAHRDSVFIHTNAGYGLFFEDCDGCALRAVTVTGGVRDAEGNATNGGVVVRRARALLEECAIRDNVGDSALVASIIVGIAGVVGREDSDITVRGCDIVRNSWDGVALYRGARAEIRDNIIDGVDRSRGRIIPGERGIGGGRGVGIGLTWDARAHVEGNLVRSYWKGIGAFVNAHLVARENIVEDITTWGLAYWAAGDENRPVAVFERNVVYRTGACGASITRDAAPVAGEETGALRDNVIVATGQDARFDSGEPYCWQRPIARHAVPAGFAIAGNLLHGNRQPDGPWPVEVELERADLLAQARPLLDALRTRPALAQARFLAELAAVTR
jgi:hypothetical protein